jgi:16S rRNA (guanine966-N2)-methyltransferase
MSDKIREALFSSLGSLGVYPNRVLDLYAGTGSIGIEALSRGATWADFVEQQAAACEVIRFNLRHTKLDAEARVHQMPVSTFLLRREPPYDLVLLDPPYADPAIVETLERLVRSPLVESGTIVAIGHSPRITLPEQIGPMTRLRERCHGDSCYSIFEINGESESGLA